MHEGLFGESVIAICEIYELYCVCGDGSRGVEVWLGAPRILRMYGLSLAWH